MKDQKNQKKLFVELTTEQAAVINGGRQGADDVPGHVRGGGEPFPHP
jgi:hypothetical protein